MFFTGRRNESVKDKYLNGSMTVEMSFIVPMVLFLVMNLILAMFYYHDKNILNGAAYETAVVGSVKLRGENTITKEELTTFCEDRIKRKCFFLTSSNIEVQIMEDEVEVRIISSKNGYKVTVEKRAPVTSPESEIRDIRRLDI